MKILILASLAKSLVGFRKPLIQSLVNKGLEVHTAAPNILEIPEVTTELSLMGVTCHSIPLSRTGMNPLVDIRSMVALCKLMKKIKPDIFLGYTIKPVIYGNLAASLASVPNRYALITGLGYTFINAQGYKRKIVSKIAHALYKLALAKTNKVFFQNPDDEALFRSLGLLQKNTESIVVNGSGVPVDKYVSSPIPNYASPKFLLIARLLGDKGIREYVAAAEIVKQIYPNVEFKLIGRIDTNPNSIKQLELDNWVRKDTVTVHGYQSDVKPFLADCSVYVLPSYREGTPRTVLEAMSTGRAIITTDAPGCRETVIDGENGFLVPIKDHEALAKAMIKLIEDPNLITSMGKKSREIAEEKFDVNKVNNVMLEAMGIL